LETAAQDAISNAKYCIVIFLDITRAFDSVWHHGIIMKLKEIGLQGQLGKFIQQFLKMRRINVRAGKEISEASPIYCGVPQGSVISPTLFTVMINDLFNEIPPEVSHSLYADDGAMWITSKSLEQAHETMQEALNTVHVWAQHWGLTISAAKTKAIIITNRHGIHAPLMLDNTQIDYVSEMKFLGLVFDRKLTWKPYITQLRTRCQADLRLMQIVAARKWGADYASLRQLYLGLIRPNLDYE
jgi:hypothetical protein